MKSYLIDIPAKLDVVSNPILQLGYTKKDLRNAMEASYVYNLFRDNPDKLKQFLTDEQIE